MRTAVVVGAGVAGLAAAGALTKAGWQVTLLERGDRLRGGGGAQLLWPNGITALRALGLNPLDLAFPAPAGGIRRPDGRWLVPPRAVLDAATAVVPSQREPEQAPGLGASLAAMHDGTALLAPVRTYRAAGDAVH